MWKNVNLQRVKTETFTRWSKAAMSTEILTSTWSFNEFPMYTVKVKSDGRKENIIVSLHMEVKGYRAMYRMDKIRFLFILGHE